MTHTQVSYHNANNKNSKSNSLNQFFTTSRILLPKMYLKNSLKKGYNMMC